MTRNVFRGGSIVFQHEGTKDTKGFFSFGRDTPDVQFAWAGRFDNVGSMGLAEQLAKIREGAKSRIPPEKQAIMHRATEDLRASETMDGVVRVGDAVPHFSLTNTRGEQIESERLLSSGTLVLSFFRGKW